MEPCIYTFMWRVSQLSIATSSDLASMRKNHCDMQNESQRYNVFKNGFKSSSLYTFIVEIMESRCGIMNFPFNGLCLPYLGLFYNILWPCNNFIEYFWFFFNYYNIRIKKHKNFTLYFYEIACFHASPGMVYSICALLTFNWFL